MVDIMEYLDWRRDESEVDSSRCFKCDDVLVGEPEKIWGRPYCVDCAIGVRGPYFKAMRTIAQISKFLRASTGVDGSTV